MFWLRFLLGGLIIGFLPLVAERIGGKLTGLVIVFPTLIVLGLLAIGQADGSSYVKQAATGALWGLPALAAFLLVTYVLSSYVKGTYPLWIGGGIIAWALVAVIMIRLER